MARVKQIIGRFYETLIGSLSYVASNFEKNFVTSLEDEVSLFRSSASVGLVKRGMGRIVGSEDMIKKGGERIRYAREEYPEGYELIQESLNRKGHRIW